MNFCRWFFSSAAIALLISVGMFANARPHETRKGSAEVDALFTNGAVLRLRIDVAPTNIVALRQQPHKSVPATVREGEKIYSNVTVHLKGSAGSFRPIDDKPGLTLHFQSAGSGFFHGLKKFHLNNSVQDPSYVSELICTALFREAGVPATRAAHALVELNGRKLGLFVLLESVDTEFLASSFEHPHGNVYGQPGNGDITDALERMSGHGPLDRAELKALAAATSEADPARRAERLQQTLDVDRFLSFMALEVLLDHWDGYTLSRHNYRVYQDLTTSRVVFIPHDLDQVIRNPNAPILPGASGVVSQSILNTPELRRRYLERFGTIFTNVFVVPRLTNRVDEAVARMRPVLLAYDGNLAAQMENQASSLKQRFVSRAQFLAKKLDMPPSENLKYQDNIAKLSGWRRGGENDNAQQNQIKDANGKAALWIGAEGQSKVSWRKRVKVEPGHYRFEGAARCAGVIPMGVARKGEGAGLRISGTKQPRENKLMGDSPWQKLTYEFDAPPEQEVELICELCATKGEVWFDTDSLRLVRIK